MARFLHNIRFVLEGRKTARPREFLEHNETGLSLRLPLFLFVFSAFRQRHYLSIDLCHNSILYDGETFIISNEHFLSK